MKELDVRCLHMYFRASRPFSVLKTAPAPYWVLHNPSTL